MNRRSFFAALAVAPAAVAVTAARDSGSWGERLASFGGETIFRLPQDPPPALSYDVHCLDRFKAA